MLINPYDREQLKQTFNSAQPFRWFHLDRFLDEAFVREVVAAYPTFEQAKTLGLEFKAVNEQRKVQVTDSAKFPAIVKKLSDALASPEFLADLEYITGIPNLLADARLDGGGMHITGPGGRLDVHVDFNFIVDRELHRRLNILVYLNPVWEQAWGGEIELWDRDAKNRHHAFTPLLNRCLVFETSNISYHGVGPVKCPEDVARKSFAAYYYTHEPPAGWDGTKHNTIFKARPDEKLRGAVLMPLENLERRFQVRQRIRRLGERAKRLLQR